MHPLAVGFLFFKVHIMEEQEEYETHKITHGDDIEIFINKSRMITIKADDYGADEQVICISEADIDEICEILQKLKKELSQ